MENIENKTMTTEIRLNVFESKLPVNIKLHL